MSERSDIESVIHYFPWDADHGTHHLVVSEGDTEVVTACGRELRKQMGGVTRTRGGWVSDLDEASVTDQSKCGNCPWGDVDV